METRKVQITGGSTFMVTLPKAWAEKVGLEAGAPVRLIPQAAGTMILQPVIEDRPSRGILDVRGKFDAILGREIISMYISGFDIIEVRGERITSEQRQTVRRVTQWLIGPEIMEESGDSIVIHNLLDLTELSVPQTVNRIYLIAKSMFEDAVNALGTKDGELARDVRDRDDDVDRLCLMISRQFRSVLRDLLAEQKLGIGAVEFLAYHTATGQLERIADHGVKIAHIVDRLETTVSRNIAAEVEAVTDQVIQVIDDSMRALRKRNAELANQALELSPAVDEKLLQVNQMLQDLDPSSSLLMGIVTDSLGRAKDYGANIAETALNASSPIPGA
ncbi:MAG: PhoU domain-containing protein [Candidatus Bipolaricaulia bacterium]